MDSTQAGREPRRARASLRARVCRIALLWWAVTFAGSCLLNFAAETFPAWLADLANYAAGSSVAAALSLLIARWMTRRRRSHRRAFAAGLGFVALAGCVSGSAAACASGLTAAELKVQQFVIYQIGFDLEHYTALFLAWYFICLLLFSLEQTARIEEGVFRLRVLMLKAEDAALRERVQPEALGGSFARLRAALARRSRDDAEGVVMALAEGLRTALSSHEQGALWEERRDFESLDPADAGVAHGDAPWFGRKFANYRIMNCAFWGIVFVVLFVSLAPVYAHSVPRTKIFAIVYWASFCAVGCAAGGVFLYLWKRCGRQSGWVRRSLLATGVGVAVALVAASLPAVVAAVFRGRLTPNLQMILSGAEYYVPFFALWHCVYFYAEAIRREMAQRTVLAQTAEAAAAARNSMLRYQVRPHFLFNALNALFALIADGHWTRAGAMTEALSAYIGRSFAEDERELVPICEQVEALRTYLSIERVRFGDRLRIRLDIPERLAAACAPSLILQPLIENAMKYAVGATAGLVDVEVSAELIGDALLLRVRDSGGDSQAPVPPGLGIGLRNVAARLAGHYGARGSLECKRLTPKGFAAEIRLPLQFASISSAA